MTGVIALHAAQCTNSTVRLVILKPAVGVSGKGDGVSCIVGAKVQRDMDSDD